MAKIDEAEFSGPFGTVIYFNAFIQFCIAWARGENFSANDLGALEMFVRRKMVKYRAEMKDIMVETDNHKSQRRRNFREQRLLSGRSDIYLRHAQVTPNYNWV
jgi:hypothetical protein